MESQRLSLVEDLEHRPGTRDDALIKNAFIEKQDDTYVVKRPGLSILSAGAGNGNGIYFYNNILYTWDITIPNNTPLTLNIWSPNVTYSIGSSAYSYNNAHNGVINWTAVTPVKGVPPQVPDWAPIVGYPGNTLSFYVTVLPDFPSNGNGVNNICWGFALSSTFTNISIDYFSTSFYRVENKQPSVVSFLNTVNSPFPTAGAVGNFFASLTVGTAINFKFVYDSLNITMYLNNIVIDTFAHNLILNEKLTSVSLLQNDPTWGISNIILT